MKIVKLYECDFCGNQYRTSEAANECEANCLGLTVKEYKEYNTLLEKERVAYSLSAFTSGPEKRKRCDIATRAVVDFQKKHGFVDNR